MKTVTGKIMARSGNGKTGPIPVLSRDQWSCPTTCAFYGNGCYGENWGANPRTLFQIAADSEGILTEADLTREMGRKPARTFKGRALRRTLPIVRDREVGDVLDGYGNVDRDYMETVASAAEAAGKRVFGYTHVQEVTAADVPSNYVMNASCGTPQQVREAWGRGLAAVMVGGSPRVRRCVRAYWRGNESVLLMASRCRLR